MRSENIFCIALSCVASAFYLLFPAKEGVNYTAIREGLIFRYIATTHSAICVDPASLSENDAMTHFSIFVYVLLFRNVAMTHSEASVESLFLANIAMKFTAIRADPLFLVVFVLARSHNVQLTNRVASRPE